LLLSELNRLRAATAERQAGHAEEHEQTRGRLRDRRDFLPHGATKVRGDRPREVRGDRPRNTYQRGG